MAAETSFADSNHRLRILVKYFPNFTFRIILVNKFTIGSFFGYKDRLPKTDVPGDVPGEPLFTHAPGRWLAGTKQLREEAGEE